MLNLCLTVYIHKNLSAPQLLDLVGANFSVQLSSRTQFAELENKKVIAQNQCENINPGFATCFI